ncbi:MAG TPA: hypothetical protein VEQ60_31705, partial [Longimicrobium sp.]|nr:hypothetical protein [Longimicrobium sp.]
MTEVLETTEPQRIAAPARIVPGADAPLVHPWNDTVRDFPAGVCVHELVEAQARRTPGAVALSCEGRSLTYRELDA